MIFTIIGASILITLAAFLLYLVIYFAKIALSNAKTTAEDGETLHKIIYIFSIVFWIIFLSFIFYILYKLIIEPLWYFLF